MWETAGQRWRGDPRSYGETTYCRGSPSGSDGKVSPRCRRPGFDPWVGKIPRRRAWQPTPVFLPGESHGQRSLEGYSSWGRKGSDTAERLSTTYLQRQGGLGRPPRDPTSQDGGGRASARRWGPQPGFHADRLPRRVGLTFCGPPPTYERLIVIRYVSARREDSSEGTRGRAATRTETGQVSSGVD